MRTVAADSHRVILQLRWEPQFQFAGYYIALHKGYFKAEDLDVEIRSGVNPGPHFLSAVKEVNEGRATFGIGSVDVALARANGAPLSVILSVFQHSPIAIYTKTEKAITNLSELLKLRFSKGLQKNGPAEIELRALLRDQGYNLSDVIVPKIKKRSFEAFVDGEVDVHPGFSLSTPWVGKSKGLDLKAIGPAEFGIRFYGDSIFAREDFIRSNPELVSAFIRASVKGWRYALEHPDEAIDLIVGSYDRVNKVDDIRGFNEFQARIVRDLIDWPRVSLGNTSTDRWNNVIKHMDRLGLVENIDRLSDFVLDPQAIEIAAHDRFSFLVLLALTVTGCVAVGVTGFALLLRKEVAKRTLEIENARQMAEEANLAKSDFLAIMSHELRTPLNAVIGFSDLLTVSSVKKLSPEKISSYAEFIGASGRTLLHLINDILDFAKIDTAEFDLRNEPFRLSDELANISSLFEVKASENNVTLRTDLPDLAIPVNGDAIRLRQVVFNLVDNAIKFSRDGTVEISARINKISEDGLELIVTVKDNGVGISEDGLPFIFEPFSQAQKSISREFGGTGLGLAIARSLARKMGGDIVVTSVLGEGSEFEARFVFEDLSNQHTVLSQDLAASVSSSPVNLGLDVLAVDDVEANLDVAAALLGEFGCRCHKARNGQEAIDWLEDHHADVVLMDIHMPVMDGMEAARAIIRDIGHKDNTAIFAWTADVTSQVKLKATEIPWAGIVFKPTTRDALLDQLASFDRDAA